MRKLVLFLLLFAHNLSAQNLDLFQEKLFVAKNGFELPYRILYPPKYDKKGSYAVVLLLHGAGERGEDNRSQLKHAAADFEGSMEDFPCILIVPQCPKDSYWSSVKIDRSNRLLGLDFDYDRAITASLSAAIELTRFVVKKEGGDRDRIYITGLSMGGMGTFEAVFRFPKVFAAAIPVCGAGEADAYGNRQSGIPFWIFHGEADPTISVDESRRMMDRLKELDGDVRYTEYPGVGHNSWVNAYKEPGLFEWLFSQKK